MTQWDKNWSSSRGKGPLRERPGQEELRAEGWERVSTTEYPRQSTESYETATSEGAGASGAQGISPEEGKMFCAQNPPDLSLIQLLVGSAMGVAQFQSPLELLEQTGTLQKFSVS